MSTRGRIPGPERGQGRPPGPERGQGPPPGPLGVPFGDQPVPTTVHRGAQPAPEDNPGEASGKSDAEPIGPTAAQPKTEDK